MSNKAWTHNRRTFLAACGGGLALLPMLEADGLACLETPPKRMIFLVWTNGGAGADQWVDGDDGQPVSYFKPWTDLAPDTSIVQGFSTNGMIEALHNARVSILCEPNFAVRDGDANHRMSMAVPSMDQILAREFERQGKIWTRPTLNLGVKSDGYRLIWRGSEDPVEPEQDPWRLTEQLFVGDDDTGPDPAIQRRLALRRSLLDQKRRELARFKTLIGKADKYKIEAWEQSIRELEGRLTPGVPIAGCSPPELVPVGADFDPMYYVNFPKVMRAQMDLAVAALGSNVTNIVTLELDNSWGDGTNFVWLDPELFKRESTEDTASGNNHHACAHAGDHRKVLIDTWYMEQFAYLVNKLKSTPEGNGTMLDSTVVVIANDGRNGGGHDSDNVPWMLAGGKWYFKHGGFHDTRDHFGYDSKNLPKERLLLMMGRALGAEWDGFGAHSAEIPELRV